MTLLDLASYTITVKPNQAINHRTWGMKSAPKREDLADVIVKTYWMSKGNQSLQRFISAWCLVVHEFDYVTTITNLIRSPAGLSSLSENEIAHIYSAFVRANTSGHKENDKDMSKKRFLQMLRGDHIRTYWALYKFWMRFGEHSCKYYKSESDFIEAIKLCHTMYPHLGKLINKYVQARTALMYMCEKKLHQPLPRMTVERIYGDFHMYDEILSAYNAYRMSKPGWPKISELCKDERYRLVGGDL